MKKINEYILEKLKIDKDTEIENPYKGIPLENTLSHLMGDFYKEFFILNMYDVSKSGDDEITIEINKEAKSLYPEIKDKLDELSDFYKIYEIEENSDQENFKIIIKYEESE